ncbi:MAG TPA: DinB family protein [Nitrospirota bacterium]|nr:DinB family protein [Nitrospirota bacterium]
MDIRTCKLLAQYNQTANRKMNDCIRKLSGAQWEQEFGGYFRSIKQLCGHIYLSDFNWLKRTSQGRAFQFREDPLFAQDMSYSSAPFDTVDDYVNKRETLDQKIMLLAAEMTAADLDRSVTFQTIKGDMMTKNIGGSLLHMFNHQTHHRGMISLYLDSMKIENDFSSLLPLI